MTEPLKKFEQTPQGLLLKLRPTKLYSSNKGVLTSANFISPSVKDIILDREYGLRLGFYVSQQDTDWTGELMISDVSDLSHVVNLARLNENETWDDLKTRYFRIYTRANYMGKNLLYGFDIFVENPLK